VAESDRPEPDRHPAERASGDPFGWSDLFRVRSPDDAERWLRERLRRAGDDGGGPGDARLRSALDAWEAAREELARTERGLRARTLEIGLIQSLGQRAAEATGIRDLFARVADVLESAGDQRVALAVHRRNGRVEAEAFVGAPAETAALDTLARRAERFLGWEPSAELAVAVRRTGGYDPARSPTRTVREQDTTFLPVRRRGRTVACLTLLHDVAPDESRQRVLFSAANQVSLHLDRILSVRESEQDRFRSILDSMSPAVVLTDADLRIVHANRAAVALLERLGMPSGEGDVADGSALDLAALARRVRTGGEVQVEHERRLPSGDVLHVNVSAFGSPEADAAGTVVVLTDVTHARAMQDQLAQAEKMSSLGQMISGVAHELNNPLASILGYSQLLRATTADDGLRSKLEILDQESRRCQRIVRNLLSFARRHEPERAAVALNELVHSVLGLVRYPMKVDGIAVETALDPDLPAIAGDAHLLQQVLINLLTNAHHALRDAGRGGTVRVSTGLSAGGRARIVVEDDGPGVPEEIRTRVFDPFFTTKAVGQGTGLGLSLVYGNVRSHDGTVALEDAAGGGARFVVELPVGTLDTDAEADAATTRVATPARAARVLVADDEDRITDLVREVLAADGHDVTVARDAAEAAFLAVAGEFDVVVLDWRMPGGGAARLIDRLREERPEMLRRIVIATGDTVSREPDDLARREGIPVVHKPFDVEELRRAVLDRARGGGG